MHILFVMPGMGFGGAERVVANLANEFIKENDVTIILTSGKDEVAYRLDDRVKLKIVSIESGALKTWLFVRKFCIQIKPDVVIAFMADTGVMSAMFLAGTKIPVISSERNDPSRKRNDVSSVLKLLGKIAPLFTSGYVFQSEGAKACYPRNVQKKSCIILNPLDTDKLPTRNQDKTDNRIVSVGRLHPQKNHKMLIKAFAASKAKENHTLHIYGDGELRGELENLIDSVDMKGKIFLEGNSNQVHEDIKNAKLFVFTSDYEGLPNALMEAMAIGIPCISTNCSPGGAKMLIDSGENGVLIPCGDVNGLVCEMDSLCNNPLRLAELGKKAQFIKEKTKISEIADRWIDFISQSIK